MICLCGSQSSTHDPRCPFPCYSESDRRAGDWWAAYRANIAAMGSADPGRPILPAGDNGGNDGFYWSG